MNPSAVDYYFERFGFCPQLIFEPPASGLGLVVVIPCYHEPSLIDALESLWRCDRTTAAVEVIIVINSGEGAPAEILEQNLRAASAARAWIHQHSGDPQFRFNVLEFPQLPKKKAGVGLARKIGMDEAVRRLDGAGKPDGVIICFDADCTCDPNYLHELEAYFKSNPASPGCSVYFEHPLEGPEAPQVYEAVTFYEIHLRYYVEGLRFARFPHAFHTIGSSMAARANAYVKQGGMNKRQAGEDFYFLHKLIPLGGFGEVNSTRVLASPRPSDRVPFGTGRAVREYLDGGSFSSYPLEAFVDLRQLFLQVDAFAVSDQNLKLLPEILQSFLRDQHVEQQLRIIRENSASPEAFRKRFFGWFDGFLAMKYIHYARDQRYGAAEILSVAQEMYELRSSTSLGDSEPRELLRSYRDWQRAGSWSARNATASPQALPLA